MSVLVKHQLELVQPQDPRREAIFSSGQKEEDCYREDCLKTIIVGTYTLALSQRRMCFMMQHKRTHFKDIE